MRLSPADSSFPADQSSLPTALPLFFALLLDNSSRPKAWLPLLSLQPRLCDERSVPQDMGQLRLPKGWAGAESWKVEDEGWKR